MPCYLLVYYFLHIILLIGKIKSSINTHRNQCCARFLPITKLPDFPLFLEGSEPHVDCDWELKMSTRECTICTFGAGLDISFGRWSFPWESHCEHFWKWQYFHSSTDWQLDYLELELSWVEGEGEWQFFGSWKLLVMADCNRREIWLLMWKVL